MHEPLLLTSDAEHLPRNLATEHPVNRVVRFVIDVSRHHQPLCHHGLPEPFAHLRRHPELRHLDLPAAGDICGVRGERFAKQRQTRSDGHNPTSLVGRHTAVACDEIGNDAAAARHVAPPVGFVARARGIRRGRVGAAGVRAIDAPARGRIPERIRELERGATVQRNDDLRAALAIARASDDDRAIVILQRTGYDLGGTRRVGVLEDDNRQLGPPLRRVIDVQRVGRRQASPGRCNLLAHVEKQVGDRDALREQATRIAPEVQHERARTSLHERVHHARDVERCRVGE